MREIVLYGGELISREELHRQLAEKLSFPEWYGKNLDALWDCLTDVREPTLIRLQESERMMEQLGSYANVVLRVLTEAAGENPQLEVLIDEE